MVRLGLSVTEFLNLDMAEFNALAKEYNDKITEQMVVQAGGTGKRAGAVEISNFPTFRKKPSLFKRQTKCYTI